MNIITHDKKKPLTVSLINSGECVQFIGFETNSNFSGYWIKSKFHTTGLALFVRLSDGETHAPTNSTCVKLVAADVVLEGV